MCWDQLFSSSFTQKGLSFPYLPLSHQIRAHLAHIGHPILGDGKYGINEINKKFKCKYQMLENYKIKFDFTSNSGALEYLNQKEIILK